MKTVSNEFRKKMYDGAQFYQEAKIVFADGREKELGKRDFYISGNSYSDGPGINAFPLGEAVAKHITMTLVNDDDRFSDYDFYMAKIRVLLKCDLSSEITESILLGTYTVTTPETYGSSVTVEALDDMYKGDEEYTTELIFPVTIGIMLRDSCSKVGVSLLSTTFSNDSFVIQNKPEGITHRQLWGMIAMLAGGNARMNENNYLEVVEYDFSYFEKKGLDGGCFDANITYESGDKADGGDFTDWSSGDSFDGGNFEELNDFHFFYRMKTPTIATDDVVITGALAIVDETEYLFGKEGYVIKIENQLLNENPDEAIKLIGKKIVGLQFRPFTLDHIAYPLAEFGDLCYVADRKGNVYQSVVTDVNFTFFGYTTLSCTADDPLRNSSRYYSKEAETIIKTRRDTKKQISAYNLAVQQLTNLMANAFGIFKTEEKQKDGSTIYYMHNKPNLSESSTIWKMTADAFSVSTDGGKTWNAGLDNEGNAVVNMLSAIGINANWIVAGLITDVLGKNFWNLDTGEFAMSATAKVGNSTVASQQNVADAKDSAFLYADNAVDGLNNSLTMQDVFNRLTNNGTVQGIFMKDGQLYVNASYLEGGTIATSKFQSKGTDGDTYLEIDKGALQSFSKNTGYKGIQIKGMYLTAYSWQHSGERVGYVGSFYRSLDGDSLAMVCESDKFIELDYIDVATDTHYPMLTANKEGTGEIIIYFDFEHKGNVIYNGRTQFERNGVEYARHYVGNSGNYVISAVNAIRFGKTSSDGGTSVEMQISENAVNVYGTLYTTSGTVSASDREVKKDMTELDAQKSSEFIYSLKPCKFKYIDGTSDRFHHGFIAQEVKESMGTEDWGVYIDGKGNEDGHQGLRYEEIIADLVATVQSQNERIKKLEERLGV